MTIYQTRQLGIEFERRVQTILPATQTEAKLDTETIYSFLNQYQQLYVVSLLNVLFNGETSEATKSRIYPMVADLKTTIIGSNAPLSLTGYICYDSSISTIASTYKETSVDSNANKVQNQFVDNIEFLKLSTNAFDPLRIIRRPIVTVFLDKDKENAQLLMIIDRYTTITNVSVCYYRRPLYFDIMTSIPCELPMICFEDLVAGAVELFMSYVRGGIRQQEEDGRRERAARRAEQKEAEQNRRNNDEQQ